MSTKVDLTYWVDMYKRVHELGAIITESYTGKISLSFKARSAMKKERDDLLGESSRYLTSKGMPMPEPLWRYDALNPETWPHHVNFKYKHLIPKNRRRYARRTV